ncbi:autotransporter outer membrane beta-barrel domain-containing protein [Citrobacter farmeri]|uniref:autotransporter outer membrane beta-barrel domain-containing protein n=1 Tax=Citrobacter amalonaticus TaxID=35703 RepID=UPI00069B6E7B|nr:autotransporter outer membrane beta-barrel domain-containing protein [Citrobacter amalonaticus]EKV5656693.1 autotransporter outer membrane beta-barrel domain-containing protein [Citrobacter farmeri]
MQHFNKNRIALLLASVFISSAPATGATIYVDGSFPYTAQSNTGTHGVNGGSEGAGAGYVLSPNLESSAADNSVSVGSGITITGGNGDAGGDGGDGMSGNNATISNSGKIIGGEGSYGVSGIGAGGVGISGTDLSITNSRTGSITGGEGDRYSASGAGISGDRLMITNDGAITGGDGSFGFDGNDGTGGIGGAGISGTDLTIINTYRITGGDGDFSGEGGDAISGSALTITNSGAILGGGGGYGYDGAEGGNAGAGITGSNMVIDNIARGSITGGRGNSGSLGGDAISGSALTITNGGSIVGGEGGYGYGALGGNAGAGISGTGLRITNGGSIVGGEGGFSGGGNGGNAGAGISGSEIILDNLAGGSITGGEGGSGGSNGLGGAGMPTAGGTGILGDNLTITNGGSITGGKGAFAGGDTTSPDGADGGTAISGHNLTISNLAGGTITGGEGHYSGSRNNTNSSSGGNGGVGIFGDSLRINNSGSIVGGKGSYGSNGGADGAGGAAISGSNLAIINNHAITGGAPYRSGGEAGAALSLTGGSNMLTLNTGSTITGDIRLADGATTLQIVSNDATSRAINGNLTVGQAASVTLAEQPIEFSGNASFAEGASLTLGEGVSLKAASLSVGDNASLNANITHWDMQDILLVETTNGITGAFSYNNALVAGMSQPDFAYINAGSRIIQYSLYWNGLDADAHGTFTLDEGRTFDLGVALADNTAHLNPAWDGKSLTKAGEGTLILSAENTYTGSTQISEGMLKTTTANAFANTSGVTVGEEGTLNLNGNSQTVNALDNRGTLLIDDDGVPPSSPLSVMLTGDVTNSGNIILNNSATSAGNTLTINGDYVGNGGNLSLGTVLGGDSSLTDKLVVTGNATGTTYVQVNNENGSGALLHEGIKIIETGSSTADAFVQRGRIVAGSYEYHVKQGTASGSDRNNWYLTSLTDTPDPDDSSDVVDDDRPEPGDSSDVVNDDRPAPGDTSDAVHIYRPEAGSYASNLAAANTLFNTRLQDRQGGSWYTDPATGERHMTNLWLRTSGGRNKSRMSDDQNTSSSNRVVVQVGGALLHGSSNGTDSYQLGVMAGYGKQDNDTHNSVSGYDSRGEVSGYSAGLYGTWYQNAVDKTGLYVDSWVLYNWFDNTVKGDEIADESYKSKGLTASLESGYAFHMGSFTTAGDMESNVYLRPQAQVTWMGVKANDHTEKNGTRVQGQGDNNIQTRLGMRLYVNGKSAAEKGADREFEPFIEANWIHNSKQYGVRMNDTSTSLQGSRNVGEVKVGVEGRLTRDLSVWGNVAQQVGNNGFHDTSGVLGIKYQF